MKKFLAIVLAALMTSAVLASCGGDKNTGSNPSSSVSSEAKSDVSSATSEEVFSAIDKAIVEKYPSLQQAVPMPQDVDETTLSEMFGISSDLVEDYKGQIAGSMTNCDILLVVKVKEGKMDDVVSALETAKQSRVDQFATYPVMGNVERTEAAKIVKNGNFAALLMVGVLPEDPDAPLDFENDVKVAEDAFNTAVDAGK